MSEYTLEIDLLSDTTFGQGGGVAGWIDTEVQYDEAGLPVLSGRAIKGLLVNECAEIVTCLPEHWQEVARQLFGERGETHDLPGGVTIGTASVAPDLAAHVWHAVVDQRHLAREEVLDSLTAIRRQTKIDAASGAPADETLRTTRVVMRGLTLYALLRFESEPSVDQQALLAACVLALRRAGINRTRGRGRVQARLTTRPLAPEEFATTPPATDLAATWLASLKLEVSR